MDTYKKHWDTIIIGGGQAGLAAGYYLKNMYNDFVILDESVRIGDSWRKRWDSLKLFSPPQFNGLPGWTYPATGEGKMTKDQMADYLEEYVKRFSLPVRSGVGVKRLTKKSFGFEIESNGETFSCNKVIVATGTNQLPKIPGFSWQLDAGITQLHASEYRNPGTLPNGKVLVVGSAVSGIEIALEVSQSRDVEIAGTPSFVVPAGLFRFGKNFYWWFISNILTIKTPIGRKLRPGIIKGGTVLPQNIKELGEAKLTRVPRVTRINNGKPQMADGSLSDASIIIWCTGYRPDFSWVEIDGLCDESGWPVTKRGVSQIENNLYFLGMPFQFGLTSSLVGGVGRDAAYIVNHIRKNGLKPVHFFL